MLALAGALSPRPGERGDSMAETRRTESAAVREPRDEGPACADPAWIQLYLDHLRYDREYSPNTIAAYEGDLAQFSRYLSLADRPDDLLGATAAEIAAWVRSVQGRGRGEAATATKRRKIDCLSSFYSYMVRLGHITASPVADVKRPRKRRTLREAVAEEHVARIEATARHDRRERAVLATLLHGGLRKQELLDLDVGDLHWEGPSPCLHVRQGKGGIDRSVPMNGALQGALHAYLTGRQAVAGEPALFVNRVGRRLCSTGLQRIWRRWLRDAGLLEEGYVLHSLRHTFASRLHRAGVPPYTIAQLLGHSTLESLAHYVHSDLDDRRAAVDVLCAPAWSRSGAGRHSASPAQLRQPARRARRIVRCAAPPSGASPSPDGDRPQSRAGRSRSC